MKLGGPGNLYKAEYFTAGFYSRGPGGERLDCPIRNAASLTLAFCATDTVLLKFIWLSSLLLVNWINHLAKQKENILSMDSEVGAIAQNIFLPEVAKPDTVSTFEKWRSGMCFRPRRAKL